MEESSPGATMSLIEGVGDEVTVVFILFFAVLIILIAWVSTQVSVRPFIGVVVLDRRTFHNLLARLRGSAAGVVVGIAGGRPATAERNQDALDVGTGSSEGSSGIQSSEVGDTSTSENANSNSTDPSQTVDSNITHTSQATDSDNIDNSNISDSNITSSVPESQNLESVTSLTESPSESSNSDDVIDSSPRETVRDLTDDGTTEDTHQTHPLPSLSETEVRISQSTHDSTGDFLSGNQLRQRRVAFFEKRQDVAPDATFQAHSSPATEQVNSTVDSTVSSGPAGDDEDLTASSPPEDIPEATETRPAGHIRIKLKYLDDTHRSVHAKPDETVGQFKRAHFSAELARDTLVRFIFNGQELRSETSTLQAYNVRDNSVIHCLLTRANQRPANNTPPANSEFDFGFLMLPLFGLMLAGVWYLRFVYRSYFNAMSTFSLIGVTFLFIVGVMATFRTREPEHPDAMEF